MEREGKTGSFVWMQDERQVFQASKEVREDELGSFVLMVMKESCSEHVKTRSFVLIWET